MPVKAEDLMDVNEVAAAFSVKTSSLHVALSRPDQYESLARRVPPPLRKIGRSQVWSRVDVERVLRNERKQADK